MQAVLQSLEIHGECLRVLLNNREQYELIEAGVFTPGSIKTLNSIPSQEGTSDGHLHVTVHFTLLNITINTFGICFTYLVLLLY